MASVSGTKQCRRCKEFLPLSAFNRNRSTGDGLQTSCRACQIESNREWRANNRGAAREMSQRYKRRQRDRVVSSNRRYRSENPEVWRAQTAVNNAIRDGRISRPPQCESCGASGRIEAHHEDYKQAV